MQLLPNANADPKVATRVRFRFFAWRPTHGKAIEHRVSVIDKTTPEKSQFNTFTTPLKNVDILISYALKDFPQFPSQGFTHSQKRPDWDLAGSKTWIIH